MMSWRNLIRSRGGSAGAEMAMITPLMLALLFGSMEVGNYFLDEHGLVKQVRDGARFAGRMPLEDNYTCPSTVVADAETTIANVVRTGTVDGSGTGRFNADYWTRTCPGAGQAITVSVRCVSNADYDGVWQSLDGDIPIVKVRAAVQYRSILGTLGLTDASLCLRAESESAVYGS